MFFEKLHLTNMVEQSCNCMGKRDKWGYAFCLRQLVKNLRELRDRHAAGETGVVDEFFRVYIVDELKYAKGTPCPDSSADS